MSSYPVITRAKLARPSGRRPRAPNAAPGLKATGFAAAPLAVAFLAAVLSASCVESAPAGPTVALIPAEAIAAVVVESPYKLYAAAESFWTGAGLDKSMGADLQTLLKGAVPNSDQALQVLDFARPWALAILPGTEPGKKTREVLYIPYRSKASDFATKLFGSGSMKQVADAKGYLVLSDSEGQLSFPPAKGADLSRLSRYPVSAVKLWGDPAAIRLATADGYKPIQEAIREFVTPPPEADGLKPATDPKAATKALADLGLSLLAQLGLADAALEPGPSGLVIRAGAASKAGTDLQKVLSAASLAPSALEWANQVASGSMYGYAWSVDPTIGSTLYSQFTAPLFTSLGLSKDISDKANALRAKWSKATGPRGAMTLDLDIDSSAMADAKNLDSNDSSAVANLIKKMLKFRFDLFQEVKDEAGYRAMIKGLSSDPDFLAFSKSYAQALGISFAISNKDKKVGSFSYGELSMDLKVVDQAKLGALSGSSGSSSSASVEAALAAVSSMMSARWAISNGRFSATSGDAAALNDLVGRKAAAKGGLSAEPGFAAFAKTMPAKTFMVGSISMSKLMAMARDLASAGGASAAMPDPSLFGNWYSYLATDARGAAPGLEFGMMVPASDIGAIVKAAGALNGAKAPSGGA
jgi:hypothetical protein